MAAAASRGPAVPNLLGWQALLQAGRQPAAPNSAPVASVLETKPCSKLVLNTVHAHSAATAGAAVASHVKAGEMPEHSISGDAVSKDRAYATFNTLELYGGFSTVISDSVVTKPENHYDTELTLNHKWSSSHALKVTAAEPRDKIPRPVDPVADLLQSVATPGADCAFRRTSHGRWS